MVDDFASDAAGLNADAQAALIDHAKLEQAIRAQGTAFQESISVGHEHLFAGAAVLVTATQLGQMQAVIEAVERVVKLPGWMNGIPLLSHNGERGETLGVFHGYDFHLNEHGARLIEINTNSGGGFLNALLMDSQRGVELPGKAVGAENPEQDFLDMFVNEWRLARGDSPLNTIAIVDEQPETQYLYPEFLLAKAMFERAGIKTYIADPNRLLSLDAGLYLEGNSVDLVYNRLTDFSLQTHPALMQAYVQGNVVLTPSPAHYERYADKRNLAMLCDADGLRALGATKTDIDTLLTGVPHTIVVRPEMETVLWSERKKLFFKPVSGYGGKGTYRGEKLTKRVFGEIMQSDYVAQNLVPPDVRNVRMGDGEIVALKCDVRCYVYDGKVQLVAARLYQGQTTNFRTSGGGFALVRVV